MSILVLIAIVSYFSGVVIQWFQFQEQLQELNEYTNFPIVWLIQIISLTSYFIAALLWPYILILGDDIFWGKEKTQM